MNRLWKPERMDDPFARCDNNHDIGGVSEDRPRASYADRIDPDADCPQAGHQLQGTRASDGPYQVVRFAQHSDPVQGARQGPRHLRRGSSPPIGFGLRWLTAGGWAWWRPGPGRSGC